MKLRPPLLTTITFLLFSISIFSQRVVKTDGFSITPKLGVASLIGELGEIWTMNPNVGFCVEKGISEKI
ncbi:MAG: hypothetical protein U5N85_19990 [Arcicella sp.]|nr:hypothetical protein [Arcicella sp.]